MNYQKIDIYRKIGRQWRHVASTAEARTVTEAIDRYRDAYPHHALADIMAERSASDGEPTFAAVVIARYGHFTND